MENIAGGFFVGWLQSDKDWFWPFEPFSMLKTFCKTLIKIKLAWPVCTEYEIKMSSAKNEVLLGYNMKTAT